MLAKSPIFINFSGFKPLRVKSLSFKCFLLVFMWVCFNSAPKSTAALVPEVQALSQLCFSARLSRAHLTNLGQVDPQALSPKLVDIKIITYSSTYSFADLWFCTFLILQTNFIQFLGYVWIKNGIFPVAILRQFSWLFQCFSVVSSLGKGVGSWQPPSKELF